MDMILPNNVTIKMSCDSDNMPSTYRIIDGHIFYYFTNNISNKKVMTWVLSDMGLNDNNVLRVLHLINAWECKENGFRYYVSTDDYCGILEDHRFDNYDDATLFFL